MASEPILQGKDELWLGLAAIVAQHSNDPFTKVGCLIVDRRDQLITGGFNSVPESLDISSTTREAKNRHAKHAEHHALEVSGGSVVSCSAYVWPVEPCKACAEKLCDAGIERVVSPVHVESEVFCRWHDNLMQSRRVLESHKVVMDYVVAEPGVFIPEQPYDDAITASLTMLRSLWQR